MPLYSDRCFSFIMTDFTLRTLPLAHNWISQVVDVGDTVIDATVGNGHDTLLLARLVGASGQVVGVDLQADAVESTRRYLQAEGEKDGEDYLARITLYEGCHSALLDYAPETVSVVMFNLGYLPSGDKSVITQQETTLKALSDSLKILKKGGLLTVVCYPGHEGGGAEAEAVQDWSADLPSPAYRVVKLTPHNARGMAPFLLAVQVSESER